MSAKYKFALVMALTLGRVPLVVLFLLINLFVDTRESALWFFMAFFAMLAAALTDTVDGVLARRFKVVSKLGGYVDPLTDKIFCIVTFPTLIYLMAQTGNAFHMRFFLAFAVLFLVRDQWVTFLRSIGALYDMEAKANWSGKVRTALSFTTICVVYWFLQAPDHVWNPLHLYFVYALEGASILITLVSLWVYTAYYWPSLRKEIVAPLDSMGGKE